MNDKVGKIAILSLMKKLNISESGNNRNLCLYLKSKKKPASVEAGFCREL